MVEMTVTHGTGQAPRVQNNDVVDVVRQRREELQRKAAAEHAGTMGVVDLEEEQQGEPRQEVESIEVQLSCGLVEFGPPNGVSLSMRLATFPMEGNTQLASPLLRVLLCIRAVDGQAVRNIVNMTQAQQLANRIGDRSLDTLAELYMENWPPLRVVDLPTIKKNLR